MTVDECIERIKPGEWGVLYFDKKGGNLIAFEERDPAEHQHTTTTIFTTGKVLECYHGQARHSAELQVKAAGARYFVVYRRNFYDHKVKISNSGRI